ncbi:sulfatase [Haloarcula argentinensis]|uniref:Sulfatase N-terminal domain-containing protein n=1 Tax=Haloarcula argentinensis TaxID=43776 RepID=A0A830FQ32_HALAR|nr:sulfatase [Haloarcula argentinensis]GGM23962.1 hypothetical protein GCM10009006_01580 [Haloarcula argentinensis]
MRNNNILLVVLDTVRQQTFENLLNGGHLPNIKRATSNGTRFKNAIANGPWTVPSHGSMFTGKYPKTSGITGEDPAYASNTFLPEILSDNGYTSGAFSANPWLTPEFEFDRLFDFYISEWERYYSGGSFSNKTLPRTLSEAYDEIQRVMSEENLLPTFGNAIHALAHQFLSSDDGARHLVSMASSWIETASDPWFCFINLTEAHLEYSPKKEYAEPFLPDGASYEEAMAVPQSPWKYIVGETSMSERDFRLLESLYKGEIKYLDEILGELLNHTSEDTNIVIVGDHGENIGNHGLMDHQYSVHQTLLNVPLIVTPSSTESVCHDLVEIRDLFSTILNLAGIKYEGAGVSTNTVFDSSRQYAIAEYVSPRPSIERLEELTDELPESVWKYDRPIRTIISDSGTKYVEYGNGDSEWMKVDRWHDGTVESDSDSIDQEFKKEMKDTLHSLRGEAFNDDHSVYNPTGKIGERLEDLGYI